MYPINLVEYLTKKYDCTTTQLIDILSDKQANDDIIKHLQEQKLYVSFAQMTIRKIYPRFFTDKPTKDVNVLDEHSVVHDISIKDFYKKYFRYDIKYLDLPCLEVNVYRIASECIPLECIIVWN